MANQLKMAMISTIGALRERGWSARRIARELGIHRDTVRRYLGLARSRPPSANAPTGSEHGTDPKPANAPIGSDECTGSKPANAPTGSEGSISLAAGDPAALQSGPISGCEAYRAIIRDKLDAGLTAQRIHQDLLSEQGFAGTYYCVRRFVKRLKTARPLPFRRMECEPGAEAQIDFGTGAPVIIPIDPNQPVTFLTPLTSTPGQGLTSTPSQGLTQQALNGVKGKTRRRKTHVLRIVLSHSRKGYSEAVYRQTTDDFIRCLENAFHHFGGVPKTLVVDNLKAAVTKADWYDPEINPKIAAFCEHYGTILLPTKPYTPWHKGKVERQVGYVKNNGLKGRSFASLEDENAYLLHWENTIADTRIHGTTKKQVGKVFEEVERSALLPLPVERFACFREAQRRVHRDGHVEVDKAYYSVPPEYVGRQVWARWDGRIVRIFNDRLVQIAIHARHEAGRFSTQSQHIANEKIAGVERGTTALLQKVRLIGVHSSRWAESMLSERGIPGIRVLVGLNALAHRHSSTAIEQACEIAQTHGAYHLRSIRELIKRTAPKQEQFEFIECHPIIRSISEYGSLVRCALRRELAPCICTEKESAAADSLKTPIPFASFPSPLIGEPLL